MPARSRIIVTGEPSHPGAHAGPCRSPDSRHAAFRVNYKIAESIGMDGVCHWRTRTPARPVRSRVIRDPQAVAPLTAALNADDSTAGAAAHALGEIGDPAAIDPLARLLFGRREQ